MPYVSIDGISDEYLAFLGYDLVIEDEEFKMYKDKAGDEHIVRKDAKPYLYMDDINDAMIVAEHSKRKITIQPPLLDR